MKIIISDTKVFPRIVGSSISILCFNSTKKADHAFSNGPGDLLPCTKVSLPQHKWKPAMAHISLEILVLGTGFFKYCIIKKLPDKTTTEYTSLVGLCKNTGSNMDLALSLLPHWW